MKKTFAALLTGVLLLGLLAGCGNTTQPAAELDLTAVEAALEKAEVYSDILNPAFDDMETVAMLYSLDAADIQSCIVRCSTGATAEEMALFQAKDEAAAQRIEAAMAARVETQKTAFENYVPEEIPKLEQAKILRSGVYVAYVTAADAEAAGTTLNGFFA